VRLSLYRHRLSVAQVEAASQDQDMVDLQFRGSSSPMREIGCAGSRSSTSASDGGE
jgi:hypothetical protein